MPSLSIIIPTKNEEEYLPRLFASIKSQSRPPDEVIVADADSTDATRSIAESFGAIVVEGGLPGPGRNRGAAIATGDILLFLDADVELSDSKFLERMMTEFVARDFDIATADVLPLGGGAYDRFAHKVYNFYVRLWGALHPHAPGFFLLAKRTLHEQIGGFDETVVFCEDHDYALRASRIGRFGFLSSVAIHTSVRRLERDGRFNIAVKYILGELHIFFIGPIRHNFFNYTFGHAKRGK